MKSKYLTTYKVITFLIIPIISLILYYLSMFIIYPKGFLFYNFYFLPFFYIPHLISIIFLKKYFVVYFKSIFVYITLFYTILFYLTNLLFWERKHLLLLTGVFDDSRAVGNKSTSVLSFSLVWGWGGLLNISSYIWLLEQYWALVISGRNILALPSQIPIPHSYQLIN